MTIDTTTATEAPAANPWDVLHRWQAWADLHATITTGYTESAAQSAEWDALTAADAAEMLVGWLRYPQSAHDEISTLIATTEAGDDGETDPLTHIAKAVRDLAGRILTAPEDIRTAERYVANAAPDVTAEAKAQLLRTVTEELPDQLRSHIVSLQEQARLLRELDGALATRSDSVAPAMEVAPSRRPSPFLDALTHAQQTSPEIKATTIALADGPHGTRWEEVEGERALRHAVKDSPLQVKFIAEPLTRWLGSPDTIASLNDELRNLGLQAVLAYHVCIDALLRDPYPTFTIDELIRAIGWEPHTTEERRQMRSSVWRYLVVFDGFKVVGHRKGKYRDPVTKEVLDLTTTEELLHIAGRADHDPAQLLRDSGFPPAEVTLSAGPWLNQWRGNHQVLTYFGDVRLIASIPAGKPTGEWAQSIGLGLNQWWRERAATAPITRPGEHNRPSINAGATTRRKLLGMFPPTETTVESVLRSENPKRAQVYFDGAIAILRRKGMIGHYQPERVTLPAKNWAEPWLDQPLNIRPKNGVDDLVAIATRGAAIRRAQKKKHPVRSDA